MKLQGKVNFTFIYLRNSNILIHLRRQWIYELNNWSPTSEEYFVFNGKIFTNGSRPVISSNISDEKVIEKISNILNDYSEEKFIKKNYLSKGLNIDLIRILTVYPHIYIEFRQRNLETSQPSLETEKWAVYWDTDNSDWYFYNKLFSRDLLYTSIRAKPYY